MVLLAYVSDTNRRMETPNPTQARLRWLAVLLAVIVIGAGTFVGISPGSLSGDEIADRVATKYENADSYTGDVETTIVYRNNSTSKTRSAAATVQYAQPDKYRVEFNGPYNDTVAGTNGTVAWWYNRSNGTVVVQSLNETHQRWLDPNLTELVDRLQRNATVERNGTVTVDGQDAYRLKVTPTNESYNATATVWVDTEEYYLLKATTEVTTPNATVRSTVTVDAFAFNVSIHESAFEPPNATEVITVTPPEVTTYASFEAAQSNTSLALIEPATPGLNRTDIAVWNRNGNETTVLSYRNGSTTLAVVQSAGSLDRYPLEANGSGERIRIAGLNATYREVREYRLIHWSTNDTAYAVIGTVDRDRLETIAASVAEEQ